MYRVLIDLGEDGWSVSEPLTLSQVLPYIATMGSQEYILTREQKLGVTAGDV